MCPILRQRSDDEGLVLGYLQGHAATEAQAKTAADVCVGVPLRKRRVWTALWRLCRDGKVLCRPFGRQHRKLYWIP